MNVSDKNFQIRPRFEPASSNSNSKTWHPRPLDHRLSLNIRHTSLNIELSVQFKKKMYLMLKHLSSRYVRIWVLNECRWTLCIQSTQMTYYFFLWITCFGVQLIIFVFIGFFLFFSNILVFFLKCLFSILRTFLFLFDVYAWYSTFMFFLYKIQYLILDQIFFWQKIFLIRPI